MKEKNMQIEEMISDYLSGNIDSENKRILMHWIESDVENKRYFLRQQEIWFSCTDLNDNNEFNKTKAFSVFLNRVSKSESKGRKRMAWLRYAAIIVGVCFISYVSHYQGEQQLKQALTQIRVEAPMGSQTRLILPDNTLVMLNAGSSLVYSQDFGVYDRKVELIGEGYFEVTPNDKLLFQVYGKDIVVKVLGTKFNFKDYPEDEEVSVRLFQGKVTVDNFLNHEEEMILTPNEGMIMNRLEGKMRKQVGNNIESMAWQDGEIVLQNTSLEELIRLLERYYDVSIELQRDELKHLFFNGRFNKKEMTVKEVLDVLSATRRISYEITDQAIIIY